MKNKLQIKNTCNSVKRKKMWKKDRKINKRSGNHFRSSHLLKKKFENIIFGHKGTFIMSSVCFWYDF